MSVITLTTDLGLKDYYVGAIKGTILSQCPDAKIIDITHLIPPFDILEASFAIRNSYRFFPKGSIHIVSVSTEASASAPHLIVEEDGHFFIGANNGIFSLIFGKTPERIFELNVLSDSERITFPTKDVFAKVACHLFRGGRPEIVGKQVTNAIERSFFRAVSEGNTLKGMAISIDRYGNIITNIDQKLFREIGTNRTFTIFFRSSDYDVTELSTSYLDVPEGEKLALFNTNDYLEIAINKGNASKLLGIGVGDIIRIEFNDY